MKLEGDGCPWLSPPGMPASVEISEATYNELYMEVVMKAWQKAAGLFPASAVWPSSADIGGFFGMVCVKMGMANLLLKEVLPWPDLVTILVDAVLDMLEQLCCGT